MFLRVDDEAREGQQAQQKVMLEIAGAETQVVKGKPYSADTSTETVQTLADGNRIAHRTVSKFYRDSEGRTRREETFGNVDPEHPSPHEVKVFIDDPVSGTALVLDPGSKTLEKLQRTRDFLDAPRNEADGAQIMLKVVKDTEANGQAAPGKVFFNRGRSNNPDDLATLKGSTAQARARPAPSPQAQSVMRSRSRSSPRRGSRRPSARWSSLSPTILATEKRPISSPTCN
jgi:hypothetical protein